MIVLHLLQLNGSVNYYRKWKLIISEVGVKLKNRENSKFSKTNKIVVQIYWTHVRVPLVTPVMATYQQFEHCTHNCDERQYRLNNGACWHCYAMLLAYTRKITLQKPQSTVQSSNAHTAYSHGNISYARLQTTVHE